MDYKLQRWRAFIKTKGMKYKVLIYENQFVDKGMLNAGIYVTNKPVLHGIETTMDDLRNTAEVIRRENASIVGKYYIENLMQCKLETVELNFLTQTT